MDRRTRMSQSNIYAAADEAVAIVAVSAALALQARGSY